MLDLTRGYEHSRGRPIESQRTLTASAPAPPLSMSRIRYSREAAGICGPRWRAARPVDASGAGSPGSARPSPHPDQTGGGRELPAGTGPPGTADSPIPSAANWEGGCRPERTARGRRDSRGGRWKVPMMPRFFGRISATLGARRPHVPPPGEMGVSRTEALPPRGGSAPVEPSRTARRRPYGRFMLRMSP